MPHDNDFSLFEWQVLNKLSYLAYFFLVNDFFYSVPAAMRHKIKHTVLFVITLHWHVPILAEVINHQVMRDTDRPW